MMIMLCFIRKSAFVLLEAGLSANVGELRI